MNGTWELMKGCLKSIPSCIRPETHWWQEQIKQGRTDGQLWFSLQLAPKRAEQLCDAVAGQEGPGPFGKLINGKDRARMAPASYAALRLAISAAKAEAEREKQPPGYGQSEKPEPDPMEQTLGTDILIPSAPEAYNALQKLVKCGALEITDVGLAVDGEIKDIDRKAYPNIDIKAYPNDVVPEAPVPKDPIPQKPVIIAIIDDGIGIANHRFRATAKTTRVKHFLDLSLGGAHKADGAVNELLGWSWTEKEINTLLTQYRDDEEGIYRALGLIDTAIDLRQPLRAAVSHGTHVLDTAAGYDYRRTREEVLDARPIIAVQVPTQAGEDRSDAWMPLSLKRGLDWILVKAHELFANTGDRPPLIVNCSFGSMAGPQDGWSDVERRITQFVRTYRGSSKRPELCTVVMSAGNSLQFRAAGRVRMKKELVSLPWRVKPDDKTPSFVQIWLPLHPKHAPQKEGAPQQVAVALRPPGQKSAKNFSKLNKALDWTVDGSVRARLYHQSWARPENKRRESITIAIRATDDDSASEPQPVVPAGLWHIDIKPCDNLKNWLDKNPDRSLDIDLHVHRDDVAMFARRKGRQSYFDDPDYQPVEPPGKQPPADADRPRPNAHPFVRPEGTLNAYGYGEGTVLVAGYRYSDGEPAAYSSSGTGERRRRDGNGELVDDKPDLAAVTEESPSLPGILATGTYSGSVARMNGTSVAAPLAVRALADEIAGGGSVKTLKGEETLKGEKELKGEETLKGEKEKPPAGSIARGKEREDPLKKELNEDRRLRLGIGRLKFSPSHRSADSDIPPDAVEL